MIFIDYPTFIILIDKIEVQVQAKYTMKERIIYCKNTAKYCKTMHSELNYHLGGDFMLMEDRLTKIKIV